MPNKQKNKNYKGKKNNKSDIYETSSTSTHHLNYKNTAEKFNLNINSYPYGKTGLLNPLYSVHNNTKIENAKYFNEHKYTYNVQTNKPVLTYENYMTQQQINKMTPQEYKYYQQFNKKYYVYNGNFDVVNDKPIILALQANLTHPIYSGGPNVNETNGQISHTVSPTSLNVNSFTGGNNASVQLYLNSSAYTGVQAKTLPGENMIANMNAEQTKANNANINNPAYFNYGQYFY